MSMVTESRKYLFTTDELDAVLESEKSIVIYGAGNYGKRIADYIISAGKQSMVESIWVTEKRAEQSYRGIKVLGSGDGHLRGERNSLVIIAVSYVYMSEIAEIVQHYGRRYCCTTRDLYMELGRELHLGQDTGKYVPYEKLDFLVAGFAKCGTTSLHQALFGIDDIYLSEKKESAFFVWCNKVENPREKLIREYFNHIQDGQIVGMVEPSFRGNADQIQELFGSQIKVLFLVRNPVNAIFSYFKMITRENNAILLKDAYQKTGGVCTEDTFEEFFEQYKGGVLTDTYKYIDWIKQFQRYYPREQIKIVIFEEMISNSKKILNDIIQFVGSSYQYTCDKLPKSNEGNYLMADIEGLEIANRKAKLFFAYEHPAIVDGSRGELLGELMEAEVQYKSAAKIYDLRLTEESRKKLESYYNDSVRELEELLDKNLSQVWF